MEPLKLDHLTSEQLEDLLERLDRVDNVFRLLVIQNPQLEDLRDQLDNIGVQIEQHLESFE